MTNQIYQRTNRIIGAIGREIAAMGKLIDALQEHHSGQAEIVELIGTTPDDDPELFGLAARGDNLGQAAAAMFASYYFLYEAGELIGQCPDSNANSAERINALTRRGKGFTR